VATDLTIPLDDELDAELNRLAQLTQRSKSDLVREMVRRGAELEALRLARRRLTPFAERAGYLTDEDFWRAFS
jgi:predicted transcriptional regulator